MITIHNMKNILYTFLISFILLIAFSGIQASFTDISSGPTGSNNKDAPVNTDEPLQEKNATLSVDRFTSGVTTNRMLQMSSTGNVSVYTTAPLSSVRMVVDGDITISNLSGSTGNAKVCTGNVNGSAQNGYPLVRC